LEYAHSSTLPATAAHGMHHIPHSACTANTLEALHSSIQAVTFQLT
jgi:hypothetical protein